MRPGGIQYATLLRPIGLIMTLLWSRQDGAEQERPDVEAYAEYGVGHQALEPGLGWIGRPGGCQPKAERRLHDKEGDQGRDHPERQCREQGRPIQPTG